MTPFTTSDFLDGLLLIGLISSMTTLICPALLWVLTYRGYSTAKEQSAGFEGNAV